MPFNDPWEPYRPGDFIFGINEAIAAFQKAKSVAKATIADSVVTVRQLTDQRSGLATFSDARLAQNTAYLDSLERHPKYHAVYSGGSASPGTPKSNAQFRLKSKNALNHYVEAGIGVHFILDGLNLDEVVNKNFKVPGKPQSPNNEFKHSATDKIRTVTGAELRWIYRNRDRPDVQKFVQFWLKGNPCPPPWTLLFKALDSTAPDWQIYEDSRHGGVAASSSATTV